MPQTPNAGAATDIPTGPSRVGARSFVTWFRLLLAAAFLPVLAAIFVQGPEYDEAIMMLTVSGHTDPVWPDAPVTGADVQTMFRDRADAATLLADIRNNDVHPPLHYMTAWLVHLVAGPRLPAQRTMSLAALAACLVLLLGQWRRDAGGDARATTVFALLFLLGPASFYAGSTARGYAPVFLFLTAAYVALRRLADDGNALPAKRRLALAGVVGLATGLALLTHYLAAVAAFALGVAALALLATRRDGRGLAVLCAGAALPVLIAAWFLMNQMDARGGYERLDFPGLLSTLGQMAVMLFLRVPGEYMPPYEGAIAMVATAVPTALALAGAAALLRREPGRFMMLWLPLIVVLAHVAGLTAQAWLSGADLYKPRYLALVWPFTAIVLARGVLWYSRFRLAGLAVPALLLAAYAGQIGLALTHLPGHPYKHIVAAVDAAPGSAILVVDRGYGRGIPGSVALAASDRTRLWFVTPDMLAAAPPDVIPGNHDELHFAVSAQAPSGKRISRWLDELPGRFPYVEQETDILRHRWFTRRLASE